MRWVQRGVSQLSPANPVWEENVLMPTRDELVNVEVPAEIAALTGLSGGEFTANGLLGFGSALPFPFPTLLSSLVLICPTRLIIVSSLFGSGSAKRFLEARAHGRVTKKRSIQPFSCKSATGGDS